MSPAQYLIDTSALARILAAPGGTYVTWERAIAAGLVAICPVTELEFFYSARSLVDREHHVATIHTVFLYAPLDDRSVDRAWHVQQQLTERGQHRSAGTVDLLVAATAELQGLTVLHHDNDFDTIVAVTGQPVQRLVPAPKAPVPEAR